MQKIKQILTPDKPDKKPVQVAVKTPYKIIIMVNDNDMFFGTHAGLIMVSPNVFQIYDPNGSFTFDNLSGGSLNIFLIDGIENQKRAFEEYMYYQLNNGTYVFIYKFFVSKQEFYEIEDRILNGSCGTFFNCSLCVSTAIAGIGVFKPITGSIRLPSNLKKALDKIGTPVKMLRNAKK